MSVFVCSNEHTPLVFQPKVGFEGRGWSCYWKSSTSSWLIMLNLMCEKRDVLEKNSWTLVENIWIWLLCFCFEFVVLMYCSCSCDLCVIFKQSSKSWIHTWLSKDFWHLRDVILGCNEQSVLKFWAVMRHE